MPTLEFVIVGEANPSTKISASCDDSATYNSKNLFPTPLEYIHREARKMNKPFTTSKYHTVSTHILFRFGYHEWCRSPNKQDTFQFLVFIIALQKNGLNSSLEI